jgi:hypothetical protein
VSPILKGKSGQKLIESGIFMFITLLVVGCLGAVAGQGENFEPYLREHKAFGKAVAAMICLYGESHPSSSLLYNAD